MPESDGFSPSDACIKTCDLEHAIQPVEASVSDAYWCDTATQILGSCSRYRGERVNYSSHCVDRKLLVHNLTVRLEILEMRGVVPVGLTEWLTCLRNATDENVNVTYVMLDRTTDGSVVGYATGDNLRTLALFLVQRAI